MKKLSILVMICVLIFSIVGVVFADTGATTIEPKRVGEIKDLNVPLYQQVDHYACGPVCVRMVLKYFGYTISETQAKSLCKMVENQGTDLGNMVNAVNSKLGRTAYYRRYTSSTSFVDKTINSLRNDYPVICLVKPKYLPNYTITNTSAGHYVVVDGYSLQAGADTTIVLRYNDPHYDDDYYGSHSAVLSQMLVAVQACGGEYMTH